MDSNKTTFENEIENRLMSLLKSLGYRERKEINNVEKIHENIKFHLERLKKEIISDEEFNNFILKKIKNFSIFEANKHFRYDSFEIKRDNKIFRYPSLDLNNIDNNIFEFSHQVTSENEYKNRGDVTIFLNGFPIIQIELKKIGVDLKEAFNQICRYKKENFDNNIFKFISIFIVSNETNTEYFPNSIEHGNQNNIEKKFMFSWSNDENKKIINLYDFSNIFLSKDIVFDFITKYTILNSEKKLLVLRPYQYHAIDKTIKFILRNNDLNNSLDNLDERAKRLNGFIFHATGSGKTLTSFKICEILSKEKKIDRIIFLVDRTDLNNQTIQEFKKFSEEDISNIDNTDSLCKKLNNSNDKLIVSTIQKMNKLITNSKYSKKIIDLSNKNIIFIIDECHRTNFGDMHKNIRKIFIKSRFIGFTGTPIFKENQYMHQVTTDNFGHEIHRYQMKDAIRDESVLKFHIQFIKGPTKKLIVDKDIERIDIKGYFLSNEYIDKVTDHINSYLENNINKGMLVCNDIKSAIKYYESFRKNHSNLNVATLFSPIDNDENIDIDEHSKHKLEEIIQDYNKIYDKNFSTKEFNLYSRSIQNDLKDLSGKIKLIIVVRMLTTGFDCKYLGTIFLDRSLKFHELIQTFSRANRPSKYKDYANIISYRTFRKDVDEAICLYNGNEIEYLIEKDTLQEFLNKLNPEIDKLLQKWKNPSEIINLYSEEEKKKFIIQIKQINKLLRIAFTYIEFNWNDVHMTKKQWEEFKGIQKKIGNQVINYIIPESILNDIDFELETLEHFEINIDYILNLILEIKFDAKDLDDQINLIIEKIRKNGLVSKAKLIEEFIKDWKNKMNKKETTVWEYKDIKEEYDNFIIRKYLDIVNKFANDNNLDSEKLNEIYKKFKLEEKKVNSYSKEIMNIIPNTLLISERNNLKIKIMNFIIDLENKEDEIIFENEEKEKEWAVN